MSATRLSSSVSSAAFVTLSNRSRSPTETGAVKLHRGPRTTDRRGQHARAQICFDTACQKHADLLFITSLVVPFLSAAVLGLIWRQRQAADEQDVFSSKDGSTFQSLPGVSPERDRFGDLVYRPVSYTPWPVEESASGERLRIDIGPVSDLQKTTFLFDRLLSSTSQILAVTLPRPMGIVFEEEASTGRAVVGDLIEGSAAFQKNQVAQLSAQRTAAPRKGDLLRACTCTTFVYESTALIGARAPRRTIVLYGADNQRWPQVINALKRGDRADGPVTLVLERLG